MTKAIAEEIETMIENEVRRRVRKALKRIKPAMVEQIEVPPPSNGYELPRINGDAAMALKKHFAFYLRQEENSTVIAVHCPTFLRGPLGFRVERMRSISY